MAAGEQPEHIRGSHFAKLGLQGDFENLNENNGPYWVLLGRHNLTLPEPLDQVIPVEKFIIHPEYNDSNVAKCYDIALLKLSHSAKLTPEVKPACLPPAGYTPPHGTKCYITGWGTTSTGGSVSDVLLEGLLPVVHYEHCSQPDWWGSTVKHCHICAGGYKVSGCIGDSGGPLNCPGENAEWEVHGVTSFVSACGCNTAKKPTVFTRMSYFIDWIKEVKTEQMGGLLVAGCVDMEESQILITGVDFRKWC
ncbi:chymotrypsin-like elastase family member 3B [Ochotona princeps]|uniref:chymotrypsin-like elastase family member 3B n=1 Tax=Ochotona princeps TaxID=9978 RepID=UPI002714A519|nr:chymotrypsin-like elastase family member 3B [Ochotona princeps]